MIFKSLLNNSLLKKRIEVSEFDKSPSMYFLLLKSNNYLKQLYYFNLKKYM